MTRWGSMTYDPVGSLSDKELIRLVLEAAEPWFSRHQKEWLEELIRRYDDAESLAEDLARDSYR